MGSGSLALDWMQVLLGSRTGLTGSASWVASGASTLEALHSKAWADRERALKQLRAALEAAVRADWECPNPAVSTPCLSPLCLSPPQRLLVVTLGGVNDQRTARPSASA